METFFIARRRILLGGAAFCLLLAFLLTACNTSANKTPSRASSCTDFPARSAKRGADAAVLVNVPLPGNPFKAVATSDGQWIFVSVDSNIPSSRGLAVLHKQGSQICLQRVIPLSSTPLGIVLTPDDGILVVADSTNITFMDVMQAERGTQNTIIGSVPEKSSSSTIEVALSQDEHYVFAANENDGTVSVIDFQRIRDHNFGSHALLGQIPVGMAPVGMTVSPDNRYLYITSEVDNSVTFPHGRGRPCGRLPQGSLSIASIAHAGQDPTHAIIAKVAAGCSPVRIVLSPSGDIAWVTAREDNEVRAFDTTRLFTNAANAQIASITVGTAPVGMELVDNGAVLVVANSNRFLEPQTPQTLTVLATRPALAGKPAVLATINVGAFPRELTLETNRQMLLLTNYDSDMLSIIDVTKLPNPTLNS